ARGARFSVTSHARQRTVASDIFNARLMSPMRAHGRRQKYPNPCRRRAFARLRPSPSRSTSAPSRDTACCRARPSPRATSCPLILLDNQLENLFRLQGPEVLVREPVEGFVERVSHVLRHRTREQELTELGRSFGRHRFPAVDPFEHAPDTPTHLDRLRRRTVAAVAALDEVE